MSGYILPPVEIEIFLRGAELEAAAATTMRVVIQQAVAVAAVRVEARHRWTQPPQEQGLVGSMEVGRGSGAVEAGRRPPVQFIRAGGDGEGSSS